MKGEHFSFDVKAGTNCNWITGETNFQDRMNKKKMWLEYWCSTKYLKNKVVILKNKFPSFTSFILLPFCAKSENERENEK